MSAMYPPLHWKQAWKHVGLDGDDHHLHRVARVIGPAAPWAGEPEMYPTHLEGVTACGQVDTLVMPGLMSRMHAERCAMCCEAVGVVEGTGIPGNGADMDGNAIADPDPWVGDAYYGVGPGAPPSQAAEADE